MVRLRSISQMWMVIEGWKKDDKLCMKKIINGKDPCNSSILVKQVDD